MMKCRTVAGRVRDVTTHEPGDAERIARAANGLGVRRVTIGAALRCGALEVEHGVVARDGGVWGVSCDLQLGCRSGQRPSSFAARCIMMRVAT